MLNVPDSDYRLKTEVVFLFSKYGIDKSDLIFVNDLDTLRKTGAYSIHLVDHNVLTDSQSDMEPKVTTIVDHHNQDCTTDNK